MRNYLFMNTFPLSNLPYNKMKLQLVSYGIITLQDKRQIERDHTEEKYQMSQVMNKIESDLYFKKPMKFKNFLKIMEESNDPLQKKIAEKLG